MLNGDTGLSIHIRLYVVIQNHPRNIPVTPQAKQPEHVPLSAIENGLEYITLCEQVNVRGYILCAVTQLC
jgi:hypothetical protein